MGISCLHSASFPVRLGNETVVIQQKQHGMGKAFIHLHQNERTALKAARAVVDTEGGSVLTLVHHGERNIVFYLKKFKNKEQENKKTCKGLKKF